MFGCCVVGCVGDGLVMGADGVRPGGVVGWGLMTNRIKISCVITTEKELAGPIILHRKHKFIKFNKDLIIFCKLMNIK